MTAGRLVRTPIIGRAIAESVCCRKSRLFKIERKLESVEEKVKGVAAAPLRAGKENGVAVSL